MAGRYLAAADKWECNRGEIDTFIPCLSGCVPSLLWCCLCQTATIIIWSLGKRRKRPKPEPTAAAATPNEPKGAKRTRRRHSVQHHPTHTQSRGAMPPHTQRSHSVHANSLSFARTTVQPLHNSAPSHNKPRQTPKNLRILGIKAIPANSTNLPGFFGFL